MKTVFANSIEPVVVVGENKLEKVSEKETADSIVAEMRQKADDWHEAFLNDPNDCPDGEMVSNMLLDFANRLEKTIKC